MKFKRFVAIVISLAMVLSIAPSFSLTASAAEEVVLFDATTLDRTSSTGDIALSEGNWSGDWGAVFSNNWGNNTGTWGSNGPTALMFFRTSGRGNGSSDTKTATYGDAKNSAGANKITISFRYAIQEASDCYQTWYFRDIDGNNFARFYGDKNTSSGTASVGLNTQSTFVSSGGTLGIRGQEFSIVATQGASNWTVEYYQGTTLLNTDTVDSINGFGSIRADIPQWNSQWAAAGMQGLKITYEMPETSKEIVATYTVDGTTVKTESKTIDTSLTDSASFDAYYYTPGNGTNTLYKADATTLTDSTTIEMTKVSHWGNYVVGDALTVGSTPYVVKSGNIVPNGDFEHGMNGWYSRANTTPPESYSITTSDKPEVATRAALSIGAGGNTSKNSIKQGWDIEIGKTYYYSLWVKAGDKWHGLGQSDAPTTESLDIIGNEGFGTSGWAQRTGVFTAAKEYLVFFEGWGSVGLADVEVYEVEVDSSKIANTTIKFVDSNTSTEIATAATVTGVVGDTIDLTDTSIVPETITYGGNLYAKDSTNATSHTVTGNTDTVTITYTTDAVTSFEAVTATVVEGNDPILPETVIGITGKGARTEMAVTWASHTGLTAGTRTVTGTVEGVNVSPTATVTVLAETFCLDDTEVPASSDKTLTFPESISGEFVMEFDYTPSNVQNNWIYISADGNLWGAGQIGIGTDNDQSGKLKAQPSTYLGVVEAGKTYRMLVTGNASTDTYTLVVTHEDGTTWTADSTFRTASDYINSIRMLPNGNTGAFTVKNIKVHNANSALKTITIKATGSVDETTTVKATSAEVAPIPHYDGHIMKTRTVSGNTVTVTYEETEYSIGSWYMRNNFTDTNWITQSKYIGSHDAFADDNTGFVNDGGALYGDTGASSTDQTTVDNSQSQSVGVVDQLNAGVRYFDIRLSRQEDGTFATVHGPAFENFRDVAISMAQWAKENPGEVIILDFQTIRDALYTQSVYEEYYTTDTDPWYGNKAGDDNQFVYDALVQLFADTGLDDFFPRNLGESTWDLQYGNLTNYGTNAVIIPFGKNRAVNCQGNTFYNRSALNNDTTYLNSSSYSSVVSNLDDTYANLSDGATISTIHAYTTPVSVFGIGDSLLEAAADNNPNWINESGFYNWMSYGKGDVLLLNDSVSNIDIYYAAFNSFNRTGANSSSTFNGTYTRTENNVTLTGPQANVPYSTKFTVDATASEQTIEVSGVDYTTKTAYTIELMQFNRDSVQPTGDITLTFPQVSDGVNTVDVLFHNNEVVATANVGEAISYTTSELGKYVLATMAAPGKEYTVNYVANGTTFYTTTENVPYGQVVYSVPAGDFYFEADGEAYILNSAAAASHTAASTDTETTFNVELTIVSANAVLRDTFGNADGSNDCNNTSNLLFVGSNGVSDPGDADDIGGAVMANNGGNVGGPRIPVLMFNVPEVSDGQRVKLNLYVAKANQNLESGGSMKLAANVSDVAVDETLGYKAADIANTTDVVWADAMFTCATGDSVDGKRDVNTWTTVDVTEFVKAATGDTITFTLYAPTAGAYVADREKAVAGGDYQGKAAYLEVVEGYTITVGGASQIAKNGNLVDSATAVEAYEGAQIKLFETSSATPAFTNGTKVYVTDNTTGETPYITVTGTDSYYAAELGLTMVDGAQVRIGGGVDTEGKVSDGSGLRFITTYNGTDTLAAVDGATYGVKLTAEGNTEDVIDFVASGEGFKWQEDTVFTVALTDLKISNYNRKFTATPYVIVDDQTIEGTPVTRSIYQVAAGLLADNSTDEEQQTTSEYLYKVLNAYVNQTGIRLTLADNADASAKELTARTEGTGAYTGTPFFTVGETTVDGTKYTVTLTPAGENTVIKDYWNEYVRINNNNSSVKVATTLTANDDGTYTLTFDTANLG